MPKILVVDDEPLIALMIQDWLAEQGLETVGPVHSVSRALSLIETIPVDAAILDVSLGKENCYEIADALERRRIPFAFATGHGADAVDPRFKHVVTLMKPFDFAHVQEVVSKLLGGGPSG